MVYNRRERDFLFGIINDNEIKQFFYDQVNGHIELPSFKIKISAYTQWRYMGSHKEVKGLEVILWKPFVKRISKSFDGLHLNIEITSPNHLELYFEMSRQKSGYWTGDCYLYNHNKKWRWSEQTRNGVISRTYCDDFMKYFIYKMEIL